MKPTVLITGSSRGIGRGIAFSAAQAGFRVAVHYNSRSDAADSVVASIGEMPGCEPGDAHAFQAQLSNRDDRKRLVAEVFDHFGDLTALVNNAGMAPRVRADILDAEEDSFAEVMEVNLTAPYFLTQDVARRWLDGPKPTHTRSIVFVSSISAEMASISRGEYCVSKAGLAMATKLWATRLAGSQIGVYEVRPGITATDMTAGVKEKYDALISEGLVPQLRWAEPEDVGRTVAAFLRGDHLFSTGSVVYVDGGLHIERL